MDLYTKIIDPNALTHGGPGSGRYKKGSGKYWNPDGTLTEEGKEHYYGNSETNIKVKDTTNYTSKIKKFTAKNSFNTYNVNFNEAISGMSASKITKAMNEGPDSDSYKEAMAEVSKNTEKKAKAENNKNISKAKAETAENKLKEEKAKTELNKIKEQQSKDNAKKVQEKSSQNNDKSKSLTKEDWKDIKEATAAAKSAGSDLHTLIGQKKGTTVYGRYDNLSTQELRSRIDRINAEKQYSDLIGDTKYYPSKQEKANNIIDKINAGLGIATSALGIVIAYQAVKNRHSK